MLAGVVVALATHQDQARAVWRNLTGIPASSLMTALLFVLCQLCLQTFRLQAVIPRGIALTLGDTAYAFTVGEWVNIFAPARAGDALKVILLNRAAGAQPISLPKATGALLVDKIVDVGSLVLVWGATGFIGAIRASAPARMSAMGILVGAGVLSALVCLGVYLARPRWFERLILLRRELGKGLSALKDPVKLLAGFSFSVSAWVAEVLAVRVLCVALGFPLSLPQIVLALVALNLAISVPVSVANLGVYEGALALGLHQSGVPLPSAVAIATLHHAIELLGTNLGAASLSVWLATRRHRARVSHGGSAVTENDEPC